MTTSKLQKHVKSALLSETGYRYEVIENSRPEWLSTPDGSRLELDLFIPELSLAIEVQGAQHKEHVRHFHPTPEDFSRQQKHDELKRNRCLERGIRLIEVSCQDEIHGMFRNHIQKPFTLEGVRYYQQWRKCGKPTCKCAQGQLHGPYWYTRDILTSKVVYLGPRLPDSIQVARSNHLRLLQSMGKKRQALLGQLDALDRLINNEKLLEGDRSILASLGLTEAINEKAVA